MRNLVCGEIVTLIKDIDGVDHAKVGDKFVVTSVSANYVIIKRESTVETLITLGVKLPKQLISNHIDLSKEEYSLTIKKNMILTVKDDFTTLGLTFKKGAKVVVKQGGYNNIKIASNEVDGLGMSDSLMIHYSYVINHFDIYKEVKPTWNINSEWRIDKHSHGSLYLLYIIKGDTQVATLSCGKKGGRLGLLIRDEIMDEFKIVVKQETTVEFKSNETLKTLIVDYMRNDHYMYTSFSEYVDYRISKI